MSGHQEVISFLKSVPIGNAKVLTGTRKGSEKILKNQKRKENRADFKAI